MSASARLSELHLLDSELCCVSFAPGRALAESDPMALELSDGPNRVSAHSGNLLEPAVWRAGVAMTRGARRQEYSCCWRGTARHLREAERALSSRSAGRKDAPAQGDGRSPSAAAACFWRSPWRAVNPMFSTHREKSEEAPRRSSSTRWSSCWRSWCRLASSRSPSRGGSARPTRAPSTCRI